MRDSGERVRDDEGKDGEGHIKFLEQWLAQSELYQCLSNKIK